MPPVRLLWSLVCPGGSLSKWIDNSSDCIVFEHRSRDEPLFKPIRCFLSTGGANVPMKKKKAQRGHAAILSSSVMLVENRLLFRGLQLALVSAVTGSANVALRVGLQSRHGRASAGTSLCLKLAIVEPERERTNYLKLRVSGGDSSWARSNNLSRKELSFNLKSCERSIQTRKTSNQLCHRFSWNSLRFLSCLLFSGIKKRCKVAILWRVIACGQIGFSNGFVH